MSVVCDKCGEELMGAVNRCWKCGTMFSRVESDDQPPIRRAPVLAAYLAPAAQQGAEEVLLAETIDTPQEVKSAAAADRWQAALRQLDLFSLAAAILALVACWVAYRSAWGIPLGAIAVVWGANRIRRRRTWATVAAFLASVAAMLFALVRLMAFLYTAMTGANLFVTLFGP